MNMKYPVLAKIRQHEKYNEEVYPNVWLMDNHKWAFYVWENYRYHNADGIPPVLVHIDQHWDGVNDFQSQGRIHSLLRIKSSDEIKKLIERNSFVRYDSFIAPSIICGFIKEVHFYCLQDDTEIGLDDDLLYRYGAKQFIHKTIDSLIQRVEGRPLLFDLDLDVFNRSEQWGVGDIWPREDIERFMDKCSGLIVQSPLLTVAISYDYSGTEKDAKYLANLVVPKIIRYKQNEG